MYGRASPLLGWVIEQFFNQGPAEADIRSQRFLVSKIAARERRKVRVCNNHIMGELNAEYCPDFDRPIDQSMEGPAPEPL